MKAVDKKLIAELELKIDALIKRELELDKFFDKIWEEDKDNYKQVVEKYSDEYENIDVEIHKLRNQIRKIRDNHLIKSGYIHELNLARANID